MSEALTPSVLLPPGAVFGRLDPDGQGPTTAALFESWDIDDDHPVELIGGWVLPMSPGNFRTGQISGDLYAILLPLVRARRWEMTQDARHRLSRPPETVVFPDIAIHTIAEVEYLPGTETVGRVPEIVIEILGKKSCERDMAPSGAKFLAYQMSGVREYYYAWPDGRDAAGFVLKDGVYKPLASDAKGFMRSPILRRAIRLAPPGLK